MEKPVPYGPIARTLAGLLALVAGGSIALQAGLNMRDGEPLADVIWHLLKFFTIITNALVAITFAQIAAGRAQDQRWLLALSAAIAGVGIVYHAMLAHLFNQVGWEIVADQGVHTIVPLVTVLWFLAFAPLAQLRWRDTAWVILWPTIYCVYALLRGSMEGEYPYHFVDAGALSAGQLVTNIAGLTLFFYLLGACLLTVLSLRNRRLGQERGL